MIEIVDSARNYSLESGTARRMGVQEGVRVFGLFMETSEDTRELRELGQAIITEYGERMVAKDIYRVFEGGRRCAWRYELYFRGKEREELDEEQKQLIDAVKAFITERGFTVEEESS